MKIINRQWDLAHWQFDLISNSVFLFSHPFSLSNGWTTGFSLSMIKNRINTTGKRTNEKKIINLSLSLPVPSFFFFEFVFPFLLWSCFKLKVIYVFFCRPLKLKSKWIVMAARGESKTLLLPWKVIFFVKLSLISPPICVECVWVYVDVFLLCPSIQLHI